MKKTTSSAKKTASRVTKSFKEMSLAIKAAFVIVGVVVVREFSKIIELTGQAEKAQARLEQQFKNLGIATEENLLAMKLLADQLQKTTGISNDAFISAAALAGSYGLNAQQIVKLLPALADLAAFTAKSSGQMVDLENTVKLMGFVLEGQIGRLKLMGITMTDAQKTMIRTGDSAERLSGFLEAVEANAGGIAEAMGKTAAGQIDIFKAELEDARKEIGEQFIPILAKMGNAVSKELKDIKKQSVETFAILQAARTIVVDAFLRIPFDETSEKLDTLRQALEETINQIDGVAQEIKTTAQEATTSNSDLIESYDELNRQIGATQSKIRELNVEIFQGRDANGELASEVDNLNTKLATLKELQDNINAAFTTQKEKIEELTIVERESIAERLENEIKLREQFLQTGDGIRTTKEELEKARQKLKDFASDGVTEIEKPTKKAVILVQETQKVNEVISTEFISAVESSQPSRDQLISDFTTIANELARIKSETIAINELNLESPLLDINQ